ncbi:DMT family transporter [Staphylococcus pettenkoferi]|uniref:DMT family transporter n=1 Tax=Staphylococcus pettenkoferi TaxID=170573 RepID=UPI00227486B0|nr:DMT family transporter [Staphylococcus pettenkoferi]MCY1574080.1 DMT family transporter [Staphylococcus pettenkoferi]MCY1579172.1 DMT family transporter [Staphylococcus pettenkoferi]
MGIIIVFLTLFSGVALGTQSAINGTFSRKAGTIETTFLTFITGAMLLTIIVLFFGHGNILAIFKVPVWQLSAVFFGILFVLFSVIAVPSIGIIAANITIIVGQLIAGIVIDNFGWFNSLVIPFDIKRFVGLLFMFVALYFIYKDNTKDTKKSYTNTD